MRHATGTRTRAESLREIAVGLNGRGIPTAWGGAQGSRIRVCGPMLGVVTETSGLPDPLTEPAKDETSVQTAGLF